MGSISIDNNYILLFGGKGIKSLDKCYSFWPKDNSITTTVTSKLENGDSFMAHGVKVDIKQDDQRKIIVFGSEYVHLYDKENCSFTTMQMQS